MHAVILVLDLVRLPLHVIFCALHLLSSVRCFRMQDPSNKQTIIADDMLRRLTGEDKFKGFGFMKLLNKHLLTE